MTGPDADARSSAMLIVDDTDAAADRDAGRDSAGRDGAGREDAGRDRSGRIWHVRQILADPAGDHDWGIAAEVDLDASDEAGSAVLRVTAVNRL